MAEKFIIFDLDKTLYGDDFKIREKSIQQIKRIRELGYNATVCTGRSIGMATEAIEEIKADKYAILNNGNLLYETATKKVIPVSQPLSWQVLSYVLYYAIKHGNSFTMYTDNGDYFYSLNNEGWSEFGDYSKIIVNKTGLNFNEIRDFIKTLTVFSISMFSPQHDATIIRKDFGELEANKVCRLSSAAKEFVDIYPSDISKYAGFKKLCSILNVDLDNTYYFGDSENDYEMICNIKNSIAMGNAPQFVKDKAKYVIGTNNTDAIADFLEEHIK